VSSKTYSVSGGSVTIPFSEEPYGAYQIVVTPN
jgi:hypothetical protein